MKRPWYKKPIVVIPSVILFVFLTIKAIITIILTIYIITITEKVIIPGYIKLRKDLYYIINEKYIDKDSTYKKVYYIKKSDNTD